MTKKKPKEIDTADLQEELALQSLVISGVSYAANHGIAEGIDGLTNAVTCQHFRVQNVIAGDGPLIFVGDKLNEGDDENQICRAGLLGIYANLDDSEPQEDWLACVGRQMKRLIAANARDEGRDKARAKGKGNEDRQA